MNAETVAKKTSDSILEAIAAPEVGLAKLREPFPANLISKLPKGTKAQNECAPNEKINCKVCGGWHHPKVVHLDYVGHAALTDRLLDADPFWTWEPLAYDASGLPALDKDGGMWIRLTVCGVTRLGYGHAGTKTGGDAVKERIGDALRNAAMRFGAALDLWHKGDLHADEEVQNVKQTSVGMVNTQTGEVYEAPRPKRLSETIQELVSDCKGIKNADFPLLCNRLMGHGDGDVVELVHTEWCIEQPKERWTHEWNIILAQRRRSAVPVPPAPTGSPITPTPAAAEHLKKRATQTTLAKCTAAIRQKLNDLGYKAGAREFLKRMLNWHDKADESWTIGDYIFCLDQTDLLWEQTAKAFALEAEVEAVRAEFARKAQDEDLPDPFKEAAA